jgi:ERO1-like protein alpha
VSEIVRTAFFRYFKVNIACDCPLWPDDSMCAQQACSVCQCGDDEVPAPWLAAERSSPAKQTREGGGVGKELGAGKKAGENGAGEGRKEGAGAGAGAEAAAEEAAACAGAAEPGCSTADCALEASGRVDTRLDAGVASRLRHVRGWRGVDNPWIYNATQAARAARKQQQTQSPLAAFALVGGGGGGNQEQDQEDEEDNPQDEEQYQYINLLANPERYTGYKGEHAHRIWAAIYGQSCFASPGGPSLLKAELERCTEKRVFYRLISGMHASISAHLVGDWLLDEAKGEWGPNMPEFRRRFVDAPEAGERVANLYFAYLFVLRAVTKAAPLLADPAQYETGIAEEDSRTRELVAALLGSPAEDGAVDGAGEGAGAAGALASACPLPFDEGRLWRGEEGPELRRQLQSAFQNITRVMDCVGCEKCKLWGKLQTLGVATALKILFSEEDCEGNPGAPLRLALSSSSSPSAAAAGAAGGKGDSLPPGASLVPAARSGSESDDDDDYADGYDDEEDSGGASVAGAAGGAGANDNGKKKKPQPAMTLERNEVIALVNLLGRFSNSLRLYHELSARVAKEDGTPLAAVAESDAQTVLA